MKADQTVKAVVPVPTHIGEPAWDLERIWVPTASGLYEVDRATGQVKWLAYEANNRFFSLLKADGRLYVATSRGLYCHGEPPLADGAGRFRGQNGSLTGGNRRGKARTVQPRCSKRRAQFRRQDRLDQLVSGR